jgi:hypothetical protein
VLLVEDNNLIYTDQFEVYNFNALLIYNLLPVIELYRMLRPLSGIVRNEDLSESLRLSRPLRFSLRRALCRYRWWVWYVLNKERCYYQLADAESVF